MQRIGSATLGLTYASLVYMTDAVVVLLLLIFSVPSRAIPQVQEQNNGSDISAVQELAEKGDSSAQLALGLAYQNGQGVRQDDGIAARWYRKAAEAGNSEAQNHLGIMYMNGSGVNRDKEEAVRWYLIAAKRRNAHAMFNLGTAYYNGDGVGIDDVRAFAWFLLAQDSGSTSATEAVQRAERELPKGTIDSAIREIAEMYSQGDNLNRDEREAIRWLRKAAEHKDVRAELLLAGKLMNGMPPDYDGARRWCESALSQRSAVAANCLADIHRNGFGTTKDPARALALLRQAADAGITHAMIEAADMLASGEVGKIDMRQALAYLIRALLQGNTDALPKAIAIRAQMSDREWDKVKGMMHRWGGDSERLKVVLRSIEPVPLSK
jgi:uncharacterized protein